MGVSEYLRAKKRPGVGVQAGAQSPTACNGFSSFLKLVANCYISSREQKLSSTRGDIESCDAETRAQINQLPLVDYSRRMYPRDFGFKTHTIFLSRSRMAYIQIDGLCFSPGFVHDEEGPELSLACVARVELDQATRAGLASRPISNSSNEQNLKKLAD